MQCENEFCIYSYNNKCILNKISLDNMGMCMQCINISIDTNILELEKKKLFEKMREY